MRRSFLILLPLALAGCEDLPTELSSEAPVVTTELGLRAHVPSYARSALLREALRTAIATESAATLWSRTAELRAQDALARSARDAAQPDVQLAAETARRAAELELIAATLGDARLDDVRRDVAVALEELQARLVPVRASGHDVTRVEALLHDAEKLLASNLSARASRAATLGPVLEAGDAIQRAQQLVDALTRVPSLDDLLATVIADVRRASGADAARALIGPYQTWVREAEHAIASQDRERAHDRLKRMRGEQLRIITQHFGASGVADYVAEVRAAQAALVTRDRQQMTLAREHALQAEYALQRGDLREALERAALAAELVSALPVQPL